MPSLLTRTLFFVALCVCVTLFSCDGGGDDPGPVSAEPTFLKVGTKYTVFYNDGFWNVDTIKTVVDKQLSTDTFLIRNYSGTIAVGPTQYWVVKDNNFYTSIRLRDPSTYLIECKFGKPVGTSWNVVKGNVSYKYSIAELNVSITTGDGVVNDAIKIKMKAPSGDEYFQYISPTVGMLGNGSIDEEVTAKLIHYTLGTTNTTSNTIPPITYGSFPFLAVGKYWNYTEYDFMGTETSVALLIESKLPSKNIYKVKLTYNGDISYAYWYEDNGMLMVYEGTEEPINADPIYMKPSIAGLDYGWASIMPSGNIFIYKITGLNVSMESYFGTLPCMEIYVTDGFISSQNNYWHENKGNVLVSGAFVSREVVASNARASEHRPFIPIIGI